MVSVRNHHPRCPDRRRGHPSVRLHRSRILGANHRQGRVGTAGYATRRSRPQWSQCLVRAIAFWLSVPVSGVAIYVIYNVLNIGSSHETWKFLAVVLSPLCVTGMTILMIVLRRRPFHDLIAGTDVAYELEHGVTSVSAKRGWSKAAKIAGASLSAATIVAVVALVWAWTGAHPHDLSAREQQAYIQDNRGILDSLPQLPGSERLDLRSNPYCTNGAIVGVATTEPVSNAAENAKPRRRGLLRPCH